MKYALPAGIIALFVMLGLGVLVGAIILIVIIGSSLTKDDQPRANKSRSTYRDDSFGTVFDRFAAEIHGKRSENSVARWLRSYVSTYGGEVFNNVILEYAPGRSIEIDHIVITEGGFFVIETKSQKGTITGTEEDDRWHQEKKYYQEDKDFYNPVKQNNSHIYHLRGLFKNNPPKMTSIIIFTEADISYVYSDKVFNDENAIRKIHEITENNKHGEDYLRRCTSQMQQIIAEHSISKEKHIENIRNNYH